MTAPSLTEVGLAALALTGVLVVWAWLLRLAGRSQLVVALAVGLTAVLCAMVGAALWLTVITWGTT